ncbi:MAG: hypothetical protein V1775_03650 [Bacteroidota bacterium]
MKTLKIVLIASCFYGFVTVKTQFTTTALASVFSNALHGIFGSISR